MDWFKKMTIDGMLEKKRGDVVTVLGSSSLLNYKPSHWNFAASHIQNNIMSELALMIPEMATSWHVSNII